MTYGVSPAVSEILLSKHIGVTSLTFQGHVTPSVTWPLDSPYAISYWWSFGTRPLSLTVSEIFNVKCSAMVDMTLIRPLNKRQGHSFWYQSISYIWNRLVPIYLHLPTRKCKQRGVPRVNFRFSNKTMSEDGLKKLSVSHNRMHKWLKTEKPVFSF